MLEQQNAQFVFMNWTKEIVKKFISVLSVSTFVFVLIEVYVNLTYPHGTGRV